MTARRQDEFAAALTAQLPALRRYATALLGNAAAADDLVQDCIERALRQSASLQDYLRIGGWLRAILHNLHVDAIRRERRQGARVDVSELDNSLSIVAPMRDHAALLDFDRAMTTLSFEHRQILLLIGLEGLNYREAATELEIPVGTVMSRLARARERLRVALDRPGDQPGAGQ